MRSHPPDDSNPYQPPEVDDYLAPQQENSPASKRIQFRETMNRLARLCGVFGVVGALTSVVVVDLLAPMARLNSELWMAVLFAVAAVWFVLAHCAHRQQLWTAWAAPGLALGGLIGVLVSAEQISPHLLTTVVAILGSFLFFFFALIVLEARNAIRRARELRSGYPSNF